MTADDQTFRTILVISALVFFPIAIYHRVRSQSTGERLDRWQEGPLILFTLRPIGIATLLGLLAYMINPDWMAWSSMRVPLAALVRRRAGIARGYPPGLDVSQHRHEPHRYRRHETRSHARHPWSLSLGPAPVLRCGGDVGRGQFARGVELVSAGGRPAVVHSSCFARGEKRNGWWPALATPIAVI